MSSALDVDRMNKLLSLCPNGAMTAYINTKKSDNKIESEKSKVQKKHRNFMQKMKNFTFKNHKASKSSKKNIVLTFGCSCKSTNESSEYCSLVKEILDRIDRLQMKIDKQEKIEIGSSQGNQELRIDLGTISDNLIPIHKKSMHSEMYGDKSEAPNRLTTKNLLLVNPDFEIKGIKAKDETNNDLNKHEKFLEGNLMENGNELDREPLKVNNHDLSDSKLNSQRNIHSASKNHRSKDSTDSDSVTSDEMTIKLKRTNSNPTSHFKEDVLSIIEKDLKRTFQNYDYFKDELSQFHLKQVLLFIASRFDKIGYVQGMNFIGASIIYHCNNFVDSSKIYTFLVENLQMEQIYSFVHLDKYVTVFKKLLEVHMPEFYSFTTKVIKLDYHIHLIDWFFCLGLNKIPLEHTDTFLKHIIVHGWYYFFRFLINYFKLFEEKNSKLVKIEKIHDNRKVDIEVMVKNFHKEKCVNWGALIKKSVNSPLNDIIIKENLCWTTRDRFTKPGLRLN